VGKPVRRTGGRAPRERIIKNLIGSALLALGAELVLIKNCEWNERRESRPKRRNLELIVFFEKECVKDIREFLLRERGVDLAGEKRNG
jgi:hypothetical protein